MQKDVKKDKCFIKWIESLSSKPNTAAGYKYGVLRFCEFTGKNPSKLVKEAHNDYERRVPPWELRHVMQLEGFVQMLHKYPAANNTKLNWIHGVKNFYTYHKVPVTDVKIKIPAGATEKYLDIPVLKIEDIRNAVLNCGTLKILKALILTLLSSGQAQAELRALQGRHLKNIVNGVAVVNMTRGKTHRRYTFFIGSEALAAIHEYKPELKDNEFIFTHQDGTQIRPQGVSNLVARHCKKIGLDRAYLAPQRFRHYFKSTLTGSMDSTFIEYLVGHKLPGVESHYFLGNQEKMMEQYIKNQDLLTVFTKHEILQTKYDKLRNQQGADGLKKMQEQMTRLENEVIKLLRGEKHDLPDHIKIMSFCEVA